MERVETAIVLHGNMQYAEFPKGKMPEVVALCYEPLLEQLANVPEARIVFNFSGYTLELLAKSNPRVVDLLRAGIEGGRYELTATAYAHAILPLVPVADAKLQVEEDFRVKEQILGYRPKGFFPPELAYDPTLPSVLRKLGIKWLFIDGEHLEFSEKYSMNTAVPFGKKLPPSFLGLLSKLERGSLGEKLIAAVRLLRLIKRVTTRQDWSPVRLQGAGAEISAFQTSQVWHLFSGACLAGLFGQKPKTLKRRVMTVGRRGLLMPWASDIEFVGYRDMMGKIIKVERFVELIAWLAKNTKMTLPSNYLADHPADRSVYLKTGSWEHDKQLELWWRDADNMRLNALCDEVRSAVNRMPKDSPTYREAIKHLLLAEGSDGRGWVPIPERRLDCFEHALAALGLTELH